MNKIANGIAKLMEKKGKDHGKKGDHDENSLKAAMEPKPEMPHAAKSCPNCGHALDSASEEMPRK